MRNLWKAGFFLGALSSAPNLLIAKTSLEKCAEVINSYLGQPKQGSLLVTKSGSFDIDGPARAINGKDTRRAYSAHWHLDTDSQTGVSVKYSFEPSVADEFPLKPMIQVRFGDEVSSLGLRLPRSEGHDGYIDVNLLTLALTDLYRHSKSGEGFEFELQDPVAVDAMNEHFETVLVRHGFVSEMPVRAKEFSQENPAGDRYEYDSHADSYFPNLSERDGNELVSTLETDGLSEDLLGAFYQTRLGQAIKESGQWEIFIELNKVPAPEGASQKDDEGIDLPTPYIYRYKITLEKPEAEKSEADRPTQD